MTDGRPTADGPAGRRTSTELVLRHAFASGAFTASEAMAATDLTRSTVLGACDELTRLGWIVELDDARAAGLYRMGRPARRYTLDEDAGVVIGVDAGEHRVTALVASLRGTVLGRAETALGENGRDVPLRLRAVASTVSAALADAHRTAHEVLVTTIGVPAPVDARGDSPADDNGYWRSMNPGFRDLLAGNAEILVDNDANLAAVAERAVAERAVAERSATTERSVTGRVVAAPAGPPSFAALLAGERFGTGIVVDGVLLRGPRGGAGEMRVLSIVDGVGSSSGLGVVAREEAAAAATAGRIRPGTPLAGTPASRIDAAAVFAAAREGDPVAVDIVDRLAERLARICVLLASLLDIDRVVVAGAIAEHALEVIDGARHVLHDRSDGPFPEIVMSTLGADVVVLGAKESALDAVRADPLSHLLADRPGIDERHDEAG